MIPKIIPYKGRYCDIKVPKTKRLIERHELFQLIDSKYRNKFLGKFKGQWNWFWCNQTVHDKKNSRASRLYLYRSLYVSSDYDGLAVSGADGRVVFVPRKWSVPK